MAAVLTLVAAGPRLIRPDLSEYKLDQATAVLGALDALHRHTLPLHGQGSSVDGAAQGPLLYDLVALVLTISPDPRLVVLLIGLLNALAVGLAYIVVEAGYGRRVALFAATLFAIGSWPIIFSRNIWPNDLLAPAAVIALWGLVRASDPRRRTPELGTTWVAVAAMVSLNFGAWPEVGIPVLAGIFLPRTRQGRAGLWSLAGFLVFLASVAGRWPDFLAIVRALRPSGGLAASTDLTPMSLIVQLVGTEGFSALAGPTNDFTAGIFLMTWINPVLHVLLYLGVAVTTARAIGGLRGHRSPFSVDLIVLLWWLAPALTSIDHGSIAVYIHHYVGTFPTQFIFVALGITALESGLRFVLLRIRHSPHPTVMIPDLFGGVFVFGTAACQLAVFAAFLAFVDSHPSSTYFGTPLGLSMTAASDAVAARARGPVVVLTQGDLVGVSTTPTVLASLTDAADLIYTDARHTLVLPGNPSATLFVAPDANEAGLAALAPWTAAGGPIKPDGSVDGATGYLRFRGRPVGSWRPPGWTPLDVAFEDGSIVEESSTPRQFRPQQSFNVDIAWRVGDPPARPDRQSLFAHLVGDTGRVFASTDYAPLPNHGWQRGDVLVNRVPIDAPSVAEPGSYWVDVGRYERPQLTPVKTAGTNGQGSATSIRIGPLTVPPPAHPSADMTMLGATFGNKIILQSWEVDRQQGILRVTLDWHVIASPDASYTVFIHLLDAANRVVAQSDSEPRQGQFPTSTWLAGDDIQDSHVLAVSDLPNGSYRIEVGLYQLSTGTRLQVGSGTSVIVTTVGIGST